MSTLNSIDSNNARPEIPILNNLYCKISTKIDVSSDSAFFIDLLNDKSLTVVVCAKYCSKNKITFCILNKLIGVQSNTLWRSSCAHLVVPGSGDPGACWDY